MPNGSKNNSAAGPDVVSKRLLSPWKTQPLSHVGDARKCISPAKNVEKMFPYFSDLRRKEEMEVFSRQPSYASTTLTSSSLREDSVKWRVGTAALKAEQLYLEASSLNVGQRGFHDFRDLQLNWSTELPIYVNKPISALVAKVTLFIRDTLTHRCKRGANAATSSDSTLQDSEMNNEDLQMLASFKELLNKNDKRRGEMLNSSASGQVNQDSEDSQKMRNGPMELDQTANSTSGRSDDASELYQTRRSVRSSVSQALSNSTVVTTSEMDKELVEHLRKSPKSPFLPSSMYLVIVKVRCVGNELIGWIWWAQHAETARLELSRGRVNANTILTVEIEFCTHGYNGTSGKSPLDNPYYKLYMTICDAIEALLYPHWNLCFIIKDGKPRVGAMEVVEYQGGFYLIRLLWLVGSVEFCTTLHSRLCSRDFPVPSKIAERLECALEGPRDEEAVEYSTGLSNNSTPKVNSPTSWIKKDHKTGKNADIAEYASPEPQIDLGQLFAARESLKNDCMECDSIRAFRGFKLKQIACEPQSGSATLAVHPVRLTRYKILDKLVTLRPWWQRVNAVQGDEEIEEEEQCEAMETRHKFLSLLVISSLWEVGLSQEVDPSYVVCPLSNFPPSSAACQGYVPGSCPPNVSWCHGEGVEIVVLEPQSLLYDTSDSLQATITLRRSESFQQKLDIMFTIEGLEESLQYLKLDQARVQRLPVFPGFSANFLPDLKYWNGKVNWEVWDGMDRRISIPFSRVMNNVTQLLYNKITVNLKFSYSPHPFYRHSFYVLDPDASPGRVQFQLNETSVRVGQKCLNVKVSRVQGTAGDLVLIVGVFAGSPSSTDVPCQGVSATHELSWKDGEGQEQVINVKLQESYFLKTSLAIRLCSGTLGGLPAPFLIDNGKSTLWVDIVNSSNTTYLTISPQIEHASGYFQISVTRMFGVDGQIQAKYFFLSATYQNGVHFQGTDGILHWDMYGPSTNLVTFRLLNQNETVAKVELHDSKPSFIPERSFLVHVGFVLGAQIVGGSWVLISTFESVMPLYFKDDVVSYNLNRLQDQFYLVVMRNTSDMAVEATFSTLCCVDGLTAVPDRHFVPSSGKLTWNASDGSDRLIPLQMIPANETQVRDLTFAVVLQWIDPEGRTHLKYANVTLYTGTAVVGLMPTNLYVLQSREQLDLEFWLRGSFTRLINVSFVVQSEVVEVVGSSDRYVTVGSTENISSGQITHSVRLQFKNDGIYRLDKSTSYIAVSISSAGGQIQNAYRVLNFTIINDNAISGHAVFSSSTYDVLYSTSNFHNVTLRVERINGFQGPLSVAYGFLGDTAEEPQDFLAASGVLKWSGQDNSSRTVNVIIPDSVSFPPNLQFLRFTAFLANVRDGVPAVKDAATSSAVVRIFRSATSGNGILEFDRLSYRFDETEPGGIAVQVNRVGGAMGAASVEVSIVLMDYETRMSCSSNYTFLQTLSWDAGDEASKYVMVNQSMYFNVTSCSSPTSALFWIQLKMQNAKGGYANPEKSASDILIVKSLGRGGLFSLFLPVAFQGVVPDDVSKIFFYVNRSAGSGPSSVWVRTRMSSAQVANTTMMLTWGAEDLSAKRVELEVLSSTTYTSLLNELTISIYNATGEMMVDPDVASVRVVFKETVARQGKIVFRDSLLWVDEDVRQVTLTLSRISGADSNLAVRFRIYMPKQEISRDISMFGTIQGSNASLTCNSSYLGTSCQKQDCVTYVPTSYSNAAAAGAVDEVYGELRWSEAESTDKHISFRVHETSWQSSYSHLAFGVELFDVRSFDARLNLVDPLWEPQLMTGCVGGGNCTSAVVMIERVSGGGQARIFSSSYFVQETNGEQKIFYTVQRIGGANGELSVTVSTSGCSFEYDTVAAIEGTDYLPLHAEVRWTDQDKSDKVVEVTVNGDNSYIHGRLKRCMKVALDASNRSTIDEKNSYTITVVVDDDIRNRGQVSFSAEGVYPSNYPLIYFGPAYQYSSTRHVCCSTGKGQQRLDTLNLSHDAVPSSCQLALFSAHNCSLQVSPDCSESFSADFLAIDYVNDDLWLAWNQSVGFFNVLEHEILFSPRPYVASKMQDYVAFDLISNASVLPGKSISLYVAKGDFYVDVKIISWSDNLPSYSRTAPFTIASAQIIYKDHLNITVPSSQVFDKISTASWLAWNASDCSLYNAAYQSSTGSGCFDDLFLSLDDAESSRKEDYSPLCSSTSVQLLHEAKVISLWDKTSDRFFNVFIVADGPSPCTNFQYHRWEVTAKASNFILVSQERYLFAPDSPQAFSVPVDRLAGSETPLIVDYEIDMSPGLRDLYAGQTAGRIMWFDGDNSRRFIPLLFKEMCGESFEANFTIHLHDISTSSYCDNLLNFSVGNPYVSTDEAVLTPSMFVKVSKNVGEGLFQAFGDSKLSESDGVGSLSFKKLVRSSSELTVGYEIVGSDVYGSDTPLASNNITIPAFDDPRTLISIFTASDVMPTQVQDVSVKLREVARVTMLRQSVLAGSPFRFTLQTSSSSVTIGGSTMVQITITQDSFEYLRSQVDVLSTLEIADVTSNVLLDRLTFSWGSMRSKAVEFDAALHPWTSSINTVQLNFSAHLFPRSFHQLPSCSPSSSVVVEKFTVVDCSAGLGYVRLRQEDLVIYAPEDETFISVGVELHRCKVGDVAVFWSTLDDSAIGGVNFFTTSGMIVWKDNSENVQMVNIKLPGVSLDLNMVKRFMIKLHYTNDGASIDPLADEGELFIRSTHYAPTFIVRSITHSNHIAGSRNILTVTLRPNFELQNALNLTVSGLVSSLTPDGDVVVSDSSPWFSYTSLWWSQSQGNLVFQLTSPSSLPIDEDTVFSFTLTNGLEASEGVIPWVSAEFQNADVTNLMLVPQGRVLKVVQNSLFLSFSSSLCKQSACPVSTVCGASNYVSITVSPNLYPLQDFFLSIVIPTLSHDDWFLYAPASVKIGNTQAFEVSGSWDPYKKEIQVGPFSALQLGEELVVGFEAKNHIPSMLESSLVQVRAFQTENVTMAGPAEIQANLFTCDSTGGIGNVLVHWETSLCRRVNKFTMSIALNSPIGDDKSIFSIILSGLGGFHSLTSNNIVVVRSQDNRTSWNGVWNDDGILMIFPEPSGDAFFISDPVVVLEFDVRNPDRIQPANQIDVRITGVTRGFGDVIIPEVAVFNSHDLPQLLRSEVAMEVREPFGFNELKLAIQSNVDLQPGDQLLLVLPGFLGLDASTSTSEFLVEWNEVGRILKVQVSTCLLPDQTHTFNLSAYIVLTPPYHLSANFPSLETYLVKDSVTYGPFATHHNSIACSAMACSGLPALTDVVVSSCSPLASIQFNLFVHVPEALQRLSFAIHDFQLLDLAPNVTVCGPNSSVFDEEAFWSNDMKVLTLQSKAQSNIPAGMMELNFIVTNGPSSIPAQNLSMLITAELADIGMNNTRTGFLSVEYPMVFKCDRYFIERNRNVGRWVRRDLQVIRAGRTNFYVTLQPSVNLPNNSAITLKGLDVAYRQTSTSLNLSFGTYALGKMVVSRTIFASWFDDQGLVFSAPFPILANQNTTFTFALESNCFDLANLNVSIEMKSSLNTSWIKMEPATLDMFKTDSIAYHQPEIVSLKVKLNTWTNNLSYVQMHLSFVLNSPLPVASKIGIGGMGILKIVQTEGFDQVGTVTESFDVIHILQFSQSLEACHVINASMVVIPDQSFLSTKQAYAYFTSSETRNASCDFLDFFCVQPVQTARRLFELDVKYLHCDSKPSSFVTQDLNESYVVHCPGGCHQHDSWMEYPNLVCSQSIPEYLHVQDVQDCMKKCMQSQSLCKALFWRADSECYLFYEECSLTTAFSPGSTWIPPANIRNDYKNFLIVGFDFAVDFQSDRKISVYKMGTRLARYSLIAEGRSNSTESVSWFQISNRTFVFGRSKTSSELFILDFVTPQLILHRRMNGSQASSLFVLDTTPYLAMESNGATLEIFKWYIQEFVSMQQLSMKAEIYDVTYAQTHGTHFLFVSTAVDVQILKFKNDKFQLWSTTTIAANKVHFMQIRNVDYVALTSASSSSSSIFRFDSCTAISQPLIQVDFDIRDIATFQYENPSTLIDVIALSTSTNDVMLFIRESETSFNPVGYLNLFCTGPGDVNLTLPCESYQTSVSQERTGDLAVDQMSLITIGGQRALLLSFNMSICAIYLNSTANFGIDSSCNILSPADRYNVSGNATSTRTGSIIFSNIDLRVEDHASIDVHGCRGYGVYNESTAVCRAASHEGIVAMDASFLYLQKQPPANTLKNCKDSWMLMFRQTIDSSLPVYDPLTWLDRVNDDNISSSSFSRLKQISWPELGDWAYNIWRQRSNPVTEDGAKPKGFVSIHEAIPSDPPFQGLYRGTNLYALAGSQLTLGFEEKASGYEIISKPEKFANITIVELWVMVDRADGTHDIIAHPYMQSDYDYRLSLARGIRPVSTQGDLAIDTHFIFNEFDFSEIEQSEDGYLSSYLMSNFPLQNDINFRVSGLLGTSKKESFLKVFTGDFKQSTVGSYSSVDYSVSFAMGSWYPWMSYKFQMLSVKSVQPGVAANISTFFPSVPPLGILSRRMSNTNYVYNAPLEWTSCQLLKFSAFTTILPAWRWHYCNPEFGGGCESGCSATDGYACLAPKAPTRKMTFQYDELQSEQWYSDFVFNLSASNYSDLPTSRLSIRVTALMLSGLGEDTNETIEGMLRELENRIEQQAIYAGPFWPFADSYYVRELNTSFFSSYDQQVQDQLYSTASGLYAFALHAAIFKSSMFTPSVERLIPWLIQALQSCEFLKDSRQYCTVHNMIPGFFALRESFHSTADPSILWTLERLNATILRLWDAEKRCFKKVDQTLDACDTLQAQVFGALFFVESGNLGDSNAIIDYVRTTLISAKEFGSQDIVFGYSDSPDTLSLENSLFLGMAMGRLDRFDEELAVISSLRQYVDFLNNKRELGNFSSISMSYGLEEWIIATSPFRHIYWNLNSNLTYIGLEKFPSLTEPSCIPCPTDAYSDNSLKIADGSCISCPENMTSNRLRGALGMESCVCKPGFYDMEGTCVECPVDYYKSEAGNFSCTPCLVTMGTYNTTGNTFCHHLCPDHICEYLVYDKCFPKNDFASSPFVIPYDNSGTIICLHTIYDWNARLRRNLTGIIQILFLDEVYSDTCGFSFPYRYMRIGTVQNSTSVTCVNQTHFLRIYTGEVYVSNLIIDAGDFIVQEGGCFSLYQGAHLHLTNCTLQNCRAKLGGAIYSTEKSQTFTSNTIITMATAENKGGAYYLQGMSIVTMQFSTINSTLSFHNGGAIYSTGQSQVVLEDSKIVNGTSEGSTGGCIAQYDGSSVQATASVLEYCTAGQEGGAVYSGGNSTVVLSSSNISVGRSLGSTGGCIAQYGGSSVQATGSVVEVCVSVGGGGAVYSTGQSQVVLEDSKIVNGTSEGSTGGCIAQYDGSSVQATGSVLEYCTAGQEGGAVYSGGNSTVVLSSSNISVGRSLGSTGGCIAQYGGSSVQATGSVVEVCVSVGGGGAVYSTGQSQVVLEDSKIVNGTSEGSTGGCIAQYDGSSVQATASVLEYCTAGQEGGAVYSGGNSTVVLSSSNISVGRSLGSTGGCIAQYGGSSVQATGSVVEVCVSVGGGGAVYSTGQSKVVLEDSKIVNGTSEGSTGGCIAQYDGSSVQATGSVLEYCTAGQEGGAVYSGSGSSLIMYFSSILNSVSYSFGGCVAIVGHSWVTVSSSLFDSCSIIPLSSSLYLNSGGAFFVQASSVSFADSNISNSFARFGGAIFLSEVSIFSVSGNSFFSNSYGAVGELVFVAGNSTFSVETGSLVLDTQQSDCTSSNSCKTVTGSQKCLVTQIITEYNCSCDVGSYFDLDVCTACPCKSCPNLTTTRQAGLKSITSCDACVVGYYSIDLVSSPCTRCPPLTTSNGTGKSSVEDCLPYQPLLSYQFEPGQFLNDSSGNGYTLTNFGATGSTLSNKGKQAAAFSSSAGQEYMTVPKTLDYAEVQRTSGITFSFSFKASPNTSVHAKLFDFGAGAPDNNIAVGFDGLSEPSTGKLSFDLYEGTVPATRMLTDNNFRDGNWHHVVYSVDSNSTAYPSTVQVWVDSVQYLSYSNQISNEVQSVDQSLRTLYLAKSHWTEDGPLDGYLDDFRVYDFPFTSFDMEQHYLSLGSDYPSTAYALAAQVIQDKQPWGIYHAEDFDALSTQCWKESRGVKDSVTCESGTFVTGFESGNGANAQVSFVSGNTASVMRWPNGSIPSQFTICSVSRYAGASQLKVLTADPSVLSWFHGHADGMIGVAYYEGWKANVSLSSSSTETWLVMCGKNDNNTPGNIQRALGNSTTMQSAGIAGGGSGGAYLTVNTAANEESDFALSQIYIWDQLLTDDEMGLIGQALLEYLATGNRLTIIE
ncbi:hypothetical protein GUITHDRAFT_142776 [Guillardia theta CCMP2712]|uniref:Apple domain-containing protein n=1 Tax=Guillardia theta (strain CCMP2712) TaxID=905079 RepID=L1IX89_GUITC|nr:hypothetical protein GUITHDRAFT_142776 [Guillardia theta CCMP2712]EKX40470.1 hypothetical protein GUITHDRAFT_142776 [Guillardia theta CCMP2712]|eukprot:XP_005827450.1 hypothetical protein GUITHDRAFT_142776 [Guillardia theta CCMP2712]